MCSQISLIKDCNIRVIREKGLVEFVFFFKRKGLL